MISKIDFWTITVDIVNATFATFLGFVFFVAALNGGIVANYIHICLFLLAIIGLIMNTLSLIKNKRSKISILGQVLGIIANVFLLLGLVFAFPSIILLIISAVFTFKPIYVFH